MYSDVRFSIDTLYFGLAVDDLMFMYLFDEIKKNLFFLKECKHNLEKSRSKYYNQEIVCEDRGFFLFYSPKKNVKNDYCTIQLGGKFFRDISFSYFFINFLYEYFGDFINLQRVDCALDVCFKEPKPWLDCEITHNWGFPVPSYSQVWRYRRIPFEFYGRMNELNYWFINMISQGQDDVRLRVYDKSLELREKNHVEYSDYYELQDKFCKVFRCELQLRSDKLKAFVESCNDSNYPIDGYDDLVYNVLNYMLYKYDFVGLDREELGIFKNEVHLNHNKESTLDNRIVWERAQFMKHYRRYLDLNDEKRQVEIDDKFIFKLRQNIKENEKKEEFQKMPESYTREEITQLLFDDFVSKIPF